MRTYHHKNLFGKPRSRVGRVAKVLSVSLYPAHRDLLAQRARELNVPKSVLFQLLLEIEASQGLLRRELRKRLARATPNLQHRKD